MKSRLVIIFLFLATGCVLKSEHDVTVAENIRVSGDLANVTKERDTLKMQQMEAQKKIGDLEARNEDLSNTNQILAGKNAEYSRRSVETQQELLRVKDERVKVEERIDYVTKTYDDLVKTLKEEIAEGQVAIAQEGNRLSVNLAEQILFPSGSDDIQAGGKKVLRKVIDVLRRVTDKQIGVEGHTDNVPIAGGLRRRFPSNWELSTARAVTVVRFLEQGGIHPRQLAAVGYGEHRPIASNSSPEGRKKNRRIEIVLTPTAKDVTPQNKSVKH